MRSSTNRRPAQPAPSVPQSSPTKAEVAALRNAVNAGKFDGQRQTFALSLLQRHEVGTLTLGMRPWIGRLVQQLDMPALPNVQGVLDFLARPGDRLKHPKLWLQLPDGQNLRITIAGEKSRHVGELQLTNGESYSSPENRYFGRISGAGELTLGRHGFEVREQLVDLLQRLVEAPAAVASEFGHLTGHCCFCTLPLSDARSVEVGYGETCAGNYGLPWGAAAKPKATKAGRR